MDFQRLFRLHQSAAFFVTRAKDNLRARRVYLALIDLSTGVIADQRVMLEGFYVSQDYPKHIRLIRFTDPNTDQSLIFLTNNTRLPATTIAALYKNRWQVELFFKWIKQHLRTKHFFGTSENAVKTQIWSAVCTYVLIAIIKKELQLNASLYTCLQILSVCIFEKSELSCALLPNDYTMKIQDNPKQLSLFSN
jgi:IS4 transposase